MTSSAILNFVKKEFLLVILFCLLIIFAVFDPTGIPRYISFVDWHTIFALAGLLMISSGLKESGYFEAFAMKALKKFSTERSLAFFLIFLSAFLSTFLTNDIALFIVIPITFSISRFMKNDISRLIIFEALAVNTGSALTPIGNPQNIFLWHKWDISFPSFIIKLFPVVIILMSVLILLALIAFPGRKIRIMKNHVNPIKHHAALLGISLLMLFIFIVAMEMRKTHALLPVIFLIYLFFDKKILQGVDWLLLLLFVVIFIDFHIISTCTAIAEGISVLNPGRPQEIFLFSTIISQFISNVPAAVFIPKFSHDWFAIVSGVNVGGAGLAIGSLANIIALRLAGNKKIWLKFHAYSIPYLLISGLAVYVLIFLL